MTRPRPDRPLSPTLLEWSAGWAIWRCHHPRFAPAEFNPVGPPESLGRFRPVVNQAGAVIPTLYGAQDLEGALSETVLRNVPATGPERAVLETELQRFRCSVLQPTRILRLAVVHDPDIGRLGVGALDVSTCSSDEYPWTAQWSQAIHDDAPDTDGLIWVPRHHNRSRAIMLFGDRVKRSDLEATVTAQLLDAPPLRLDVLSLLDRAGIALIVD